MSRGDWNIYAAIGIAIAIVCLGLWGGQGPHVIAQNNIKPNPTYQPKHAENPPIIPFLGDPPSAPDSANPCPGGTEDEPHKSCVEKRSISASQQSAYWTKITAIVGFFGTGLVALSLAASALATKAALDAAKYAREALHSDRAWMVADEHICKILTNCLIDKVRTRCSLGVQLAWINKGRSPALKIACLRDFSLVLPSQDAPIFDAPIDLANGMAGPEKNIKTFQISLTQSQADAFFARERDLICYSKIAYLDVYRPDKVRISEQTLRLKYAGLSHPSLIQVDKFAIEAMPVGEQNGAT